MTTRLMKGDCLERMKEIESGSVDMVLTDPPYGTTACKWDSVIPFPEMWERLNKLIKPNGAVVLFGSEPFSSALRMSNIKNYKYDWIWKKNKVTGFMQGQIKPLNDNENIIIFGDFSLMAQKFNGTYNKVGAIEIEGKNYSNKRKEDHITGDRKDGNTKKSYKNLPKKILEFDGATKTVHPTQKPVALMEYLIKTYTNENETVLDFTMGSGTTGVAAKNLGRKFIGIEMDEGYFDIASKRMEQ
jgi:site-specific DNA-methyltransferase (adenine-specific)